jgi:pimeloyl-ACP methyl ester carboxylesterase
MTQPLVFLHGAFCGGWAFDAFRTPFEAAGYVTHAPDLAGRAHGDSPEHLGRIGVKDMVAQVVRHIRDLDAPPVLIGHSLGGLVAQIAATHGHVAGLVLIAPSAPWGVMPTTLEEHGGAVGLTLLGDYWRRPIAPDYGVARHATLDRLDRHDARHVFAQFVPESGRVVHETIQWWLDPSMASAAPVYKIKTPVLALAGGKDRVNPASTVRRIAKRFPAGQCAYREFPEMSHWLIGEPEWPDVAHTALAWLKCKGLGPHAERPTHGTGLADQPTGV